jgi:N-acetyl-anhydromuramoyl-L-alanine amidase
MHEFANGWFTTAKICESPNYNDRPNVDDIQLIVIHNISLPPGEFGGGYVQAFFSNSLPVQEHEYFQTIQTLKVSSHLFIDRLGQLTQFVNIGKRAWHAGASRYQGRDNCNDFSIGIELEGTDNLAFTRAQYTTLAEVTCLLMAQYPRLSPARIVGHSDIAPGRKTDPGEAFDWPRYRRLLDLESV